MIDFYKQVPSVYTNTSRDFQYLSWLINIVLNSVKHNVDTLYELPNVKANPALVEILALTLGFKVKRNYDQKQLVALVSIIPSILKYKGTKEAVTLVGEALINASGTEGDFDCAVNNNLLEITLPKALIDVSLFIDLLPYILPAGMTYRIIRKNQIQERYSTDFSYYDIPKADWKPDLVWDENERTATGLASLFDIPKNDNGDVLIDTPEFANYKNTTDGVALNVDLLDNTVIPVLDN